MYKNRPALEKCQLTVDAVIYWLNLVLKQRHMSKNNNKSHKENKSFKKWLTSQQKKGSLIKENLARARIAVKTKKCLSNKILTL